MSKTFTKLFSSITESTVWSEPDTTRILWITMLAMADHAGRVWASVPGLANRARISIEDVEAGLQTFLSPDRYSRTLDHEGRRIEAIDGGWRLLNHERYRQTRDEETIRESKRKWAEKNREKIKKSRKKVAKSRTPSNPVDPIRANAEADTDAIKNKCSFFETFWEIYPRRVGKGKAEAVWAKLSMQDQDAAIEALPNHVDRWTAENTDPKFIPHPSTWLNGQRWLDSEVAGKEPGVRVL